MTAIAHPVNSIDLHDVPRRRLRVAVICDFLEEDWPSMDLVGDMLTKHLSHDHADAFEAEQIRPRMPRLFGNRNTGAFKTAHRLIGRFVSYPRDVRKLRNDFDLFHIVDHSYAHLALELPPGRVIITCHDLDAFADLIRGSRSKNPARVGIASRLLKGMQSAAWIACNTDATRHQLLVHDLARADRLSVVHNGVDPVFSPVQDQSSDAAIATMLGRCAGESPEVLHVGSTIARKRIQDVLGIFAKLRARIPSLRLLRVGGVFTEEQQRLVQKLELAGSIDVLPRLERALLASVYRRARALIQPSEAEGFGLPVLEAMASGTPVIASDIPALREVGGAAAEYCPVGDFDAWSSKLLALITESDSDRQRRREICLSQSSHFSWRDYSQQMVDIYQRILAW